MALLSVCQPLSSLRKQPTFHDGCFRKLATQLPSFCPFVSLTMSTSESVRELAFQHVTLKNVLSHELVQSNCRHEMIEKVTFRIECQLFVRVTQTIMTHVIALTNGQCSCVSSTISYSSKLTLSNHEVDKPKLFVFCQSPIGRAPPFLMKLALYLSLSFSQPVLARQSLSTRFMSVTQPISQFQQVSGSVCHPVGQQSEVRKLFASSRQFRSVSKSVRVNQQSSQSVRKSFSGTANQRVR